MLANMNLNNFQLAKKDKIIKTLSVSDVKPNPYQPRKYFDEKALHELSLSIQQYGVMQPINVRYINGTYELVSGERRLKATILAGLETIPAIVVNITQNESGILALIENIQRQNLNYIEEAEGYLKLIVDYGITQEELAQKVGKKQSTIANKLRLLKLNGNVRALLVGNNLTERHGRALLKITNEQLQLDILKKIIEQDFNVKKTEEYIAEILDKLKAQEENKLKMSEKIKWRFTDIRLITNTIKQSLDVLNKTGIDTTYDVIENTEGYEIIIKIPIKDL